MNNSLMDYYEQELIREIKDSIVESVTESVTTNIARNLKDVLSDEIIAERTGLSLDVVKQL